MITPAPRTSNAAHRTALVLSGGGAKGAYQVGIMKALFEGSVSATGGQPFSADVYAGASVGSYNATYMAARGGAGNERDIVRELEETWCRRVAAQPGGCDGNGVFRVRASPQPLFDPRCWLQPLDQAQNLAADAGFFARYLAVESNKLAASTGEPLVSRVLDLFNLSAAFDLTPFHRLLRDTIDLEALRHSPKDLIVITSDFSQGIPRPFFKKEIAGEVGYQALIGSAAIPGIFPPAFIDGVPYVDGGLTMNTPVAPVLAHDASIIHVVFLDPSVAHLPPPSGTFDILYRLFSIQMATSIHNNLLVIPSILEQAQRIRKLRAAGRLEEMEEAIRKMLLTFTPQNLQAGSLWPWEGVTIHKYVPATDLGGAPGLLDFRLANIEHNIELGYEDALRHDCDAAGCIFPDSPQQSKTSPQAQSSPQQEAS